jgi:hypothetical protein
MARGPYCPACGNQTFHAGQGAAKGIRVCGTCDAFGWFERPSGPGSGSGARCPSCGERQLHTATHNLVTVRWCSNLYCQAVAIST